MKDLPDFRCSGTRDKGGKKVCWKYILGNCPKGPDFGFLHVPQSNLSEAVLDKMLPPLAKVITKGLERFPVESPSRKKANKRKRQGGVPAHQPGG